MIGGFENLDLLVGGVLQDMCVDRVVLEGSFALRLVVLLLKAFQPHLLMSVNQVFADLVDISSLELCLSFSVFELR